MNYQTLPELSPFPPGKSPFRQKGHVYRITLYNLGAYIDGGAPAVIAKIEDPMVRAFLEQAFMPGSWYDVFPMIALVVQTARMLGVPYFRAVSDLSRMMAEADMNGIYRTILRVVGPHLLAPKLPRIQAQYLEFGSLKQGETRDGYCEVIRTGHPLILVHWYVAVVHGFLPYILGESGAKDPRVKWDQPVNDGDVEGFDTVSVRFHISWR